MFLYKFKSKLSFLLTILFFLSACSGSSSNITELYSNVLNNEYEYEIKCPRVKYISSKDKITYTDTNSYEVSFYEVKWKCYSYSETEKGHTNNNIDLDIQYKINYKNSNEKFEEEQFSLIIALLDVKNEVIIKSKFNRSFFNKEKSEIINDTSGIINIKLDGKHADMSNYLLLLGLIK